MLEKGNLRFSPVALSISVSNACFQQLPAPAMLQKDLVEPSEWPERKAGIIPKTSPLHFSASGRTPSKEKSNQPIKCGMKALPHQGELPLAEITPDKAFMGVNEPLSGTHTPPRDHFPPLLLLIFKLRKGVDGEQQTIP